MEKNNVISEQELISIIKNDIFENDGIDMSLQRQVTLTDKHENLVNISLVDNPTCTKDVIPSIEVWSLFQRKAGGISDGNPMLYALKKEKGYSLTNPKIVYKRIEDLCEQFIQNHTNMATTLAIPSTNPLNKYLLNTLKKKCKNTMIIENLLVKMSVQEVDDYIFQEDSLFREKYKTQYEQAYEMFANYCLKMKDGIFRIHLIEDMKMRKVIDNTIKVADQFYGKYLSAINGKDILIIDDSVTTGQSLREAYQIIADCYEPRSITILTIISPLYIEDGECLKNHKK